MTEMKQAAPSVNCAHTEMVKLEKIKPHPRNPNRHPKSQIDLLAKIIREQGWRAPIVVSRRSGLVVAGHGRLEAARTLGLASAPVDYQDFGSDELEIAHMVADNRLAELSEIDDTALADLLRTIDGTEESGATGFNQAEIDAILHAEHTAPNAVRIVPVTVKPPPKMAWVVIGVPLDDWPKINAQAELAAQIPGAIVETIVSDYDGKNGQ